MIRRPPRSTLDRSSAASDVYKRQDLPGYGYADVPEEIRRQWQGVLASYLTRRENICGLVLIMDARRPLTDLDRQMLEWFGPTGKPIHILLTKSDQLTRTEAGKVMHVMRHEMAPWADKVGATYL